MSLTMRVTHLGQTDKERVVPVGTEVEYCGHIPGGMVRVRFADGVTEVMHPACFDELRDRPQAETVEELRAVIEEALEPGVFGPWGTVEDPALKHTNLADLCEQYGYGAVMHYAEWLWKQRSRRENMEGCEHTCAACATVRRSWIARAKAALAATPTAGEGKAGG